MDLIAVVNHDERLDVYRFNGQRAFGLQRKKADARVESLSWKFNGQFIALGWSDGSLEVISTETGNSVQQFRQLTSDSDTTSRESSASSTRVNCIGWGLIHIETDRTRTRRRAPRQRLTAEQGQEGAKDHSERLHAPFALDSLLNGLPNEDSNRSPTELPMKLTQLDVLSILPKLPVLPILPPAAYRNGEAPAAELFASQITLDAAVHESNGRAHNELDTLLLCQSDGKIRIILYDSLSIGDVSLPETWKLPDIKYLRHASHPYSATQMIIAQVPAQNTLPPKIVLMPLYLKFLKSAGTHLQIIESQTAQLGNIVNYVGECLLAMHHHWAHSQELPKKFMGLINESLLEKTEPTLMQSLFHLAVTGDCPSTIREWLLDQLTERGHKRWDHAVMQGYTKVIDITQESFLPALDRCNIILNNLQGLFKFHEHEPAFDVPQTLFSLIIDIIRCLRLLGHHVLLYASAERRQFMQFSKWLRHEIDVQVTDPTSPTAAETIEKDIGLDINLLLAYIQRPLVESRLNRFLCEPSHSPAIIVNESRYGDLKKALNAFKVSADGDDDLLMLASHFDEWKRHNGILTTMITTWQRSSSLLQAGLVLEEQPVHSVDMRMVIEQQSRGDGIATYIAMLPEKRQSQLIFHRITHTGSFERVQDAVQSSERTVIAMRDATFTDVRFMDDETFLALVSHQGEGEMRLRYHKASNSLSHRQLPNGSAWEHEAVSEVDFESFRDDIKHTFPREERFKPARIEINGREKRRFCVVLSQDSKHLRIFDIDYGAQDEAWEGAVDGRGGRMTDGADEVMTG